MEQTLPHPDLDRRLQQFHDRVDKIRNMLRELQLSHLELEFLNADVGVEDIADLTEQDFINLKVTKIGDKCRLKRMCRAVTEGRTENGGVDQEGNSMNVDMGNSASFEMGDRNNIYNSENRINAATIGSIDDNGNNFGSSPFAGSTRIHIAENSKFEAVNKDNKIHTTTNVTASNIDHVGGPASSGFPGLSGLGGGGGDININMGAGASLHGLGSHLSKMGENTSETEDAYSGEIGIDLKQTTWRKHGKFYLYSGNSDDDIITEEQEQDYDDEFRR